MFEQGKLIFIKVCRRPVKWQPATATQATKTCEGESTTHPFLPPKVIHSLALVGGFTS